MNLLHVCLAVFVLFASIPNSGPAPDLKGSAQKFLDAYPEFLSSYDEKTKELVGYDGRRFLFDDGLKKDFSGYLNDGTPCPPVDPEDTLSMKYRRNDWPTAKNPPGPQDDPGRLRSGEFFSYVYGTMADKKRTVRGRRKRTRTKRRCPSEEPRRTFSSR